MQTLKPLTLSKEEYERLLLEKDRIICDLQAQIKRLSEQVAELSARLSKDSHNSSKPPSSDGLSKQNKTKSTRESSGRKPGGQPGHKGYTLEFSEEPDHIENHIVKEYSQCGANLECVEQEQIDAHQVFDIPPPSKVEVAEHRIFRIQCPYCDHINKSCFPEGADQPVQYGFEIRSRLIYLSQYQLLPIKRVKEMMKDLHDTPLSMGTVQNTIMSLAQKLKAPVENIKKALCREAVVGFDESGYRVNKKLQWLHVASTPKLVWYGIHKKRGEEAMNDQGILPNFRGTAVHDGWKPYKAFTNCSHALCNAHHLRELIFVVETKGQIWAAKMIELLIQGNEEARKAKEEARQSLPQERIEYYRIRYLATLDEGDIQNPVAPKTSGKRGRTKQSYEVNLLGRLREGMDEVLRFMSDFRVPFTNNETERDVRMPKARLKISGCMRSDEGAEAFCTIRSYLATLKKQGYSLIQALVEAFSSIPPEPYHQW